MATLDEWQQALVTPRTVTVESSPRMVQQVQRLHDVKDQDRIRRQQQIPARKNTLTEVAAFSPEREIEIVPAYMLLRLGVVTTPAVENLADLCSSWACLRYLWAFQIPGVTAAVDRMRLSEEAMRIDFHQKALLSDQIGVGIAAVLLGNYFNSPQALDVSLALDSPAWGIDQRSNSSPDYLFFDSTLTNLYVVECKGSQASRSVSLDQLRRGTEQVQALIFNNRPTPPSLVVATCLTEKGTRVLMIDPPGDDDEKPHSERAERINEREWRVSDSARFSRSTQLLSQAKLLAFAGNDELSEDKIRDAEVRVPTRLRAVKRTQVVEATEFGDFMGVRQPVGLGDRMRVEVFQGIAREVQDAFAANDVDRTEYVTREFRERTAQLGRPDLNQPTAISHGQGSVIVRTASPDGAMLEVRITAP